MDNNWSNNEFICNFFFAYPIYGKNLANVSNFAFPFLHTLLICWSKVNLWLNLSPKIFSQTPPLINYFPTWIWFESPVLDKKWHLYVLPFIWLFFKRLNSISIDILKLLTTASTLSHAFFLIGIHTMQGRTATRRHGVKGKRGNKRLKHTGNLSRKNLQLKVSVNSRLRKAI